MINKEKNKIEIVSSKLYDDILLNNILQKLYDEVCYIEIKGLIVGLEEIYDFLETDKKVIKKNKNHFWKDNLPELCIITTEIKDLFKTAEYRDYFNEGYISFYFSSESVNLDINTISKNNFTVSVICTESNISIYAEDKNIIEDLYKLII